VRRVERRSFVAKESNVYESGMVVMV
jgi:hypothetical protein